MKRKYRKTFCSLLSFLCFIMAAVSIIQIYRILSEDNRQEEKFIKLRQMAEKEVKTEDSRETEEEGGKKEDNPYQELFDANADMYGWITIGGTTLDYPLMYTPDRPNFYLEHNFEKEYSRYGVPYLAGNSSPKTDVHLTIYGHHIRGGNMFGMLENYKKREYCEQHPVITIITKEKVEQYQIFAVYKTVAGGEGFDYASFQNAESEEEYNSFVTQCKEMSFYDTGVTPSYGTKLITLSTCEYSQEDGRLAVAAQYLQMK